MDLNWEEGIYIWDWKIKLHSRLGVFLQPRDEIQEDIRQASWLMSQIPEDRWLLRTCETFKPMGTVNGAVLVSKAGCGKSEEWPTSVGVKNVRGAAVKDKPSRKIRSTFSVALLRSENVCTCFCRHSISEKVIWPSCPMKWRQMERATHRILRSFRWALVQM